VAATGASSLIEKPPTEMRAGIAASPHCAERRICRSSWSRSEDRFLEIQAHQLRRRFPSDNSLRRGDRPFTGLRHPKVRWSSNTRCLAEPKPSDVPRPFLGRSLWRLALLLPSEDFRKPRRARVKINSSGASSRLAPRCSEERLIACRRRSVLPSPSASFCPLRAFRWRRGLPSRSPL